MQSVIEKSSKENFCFFLKLYHCLTLKRNGCNFIFEQQCHYLWFVRIPCCFTFFNQRKQVLANINT